MNRSTRFGVPLSVADSLPPPPGWRFGWRIGAPGMSPTPRSAKYRAMHSCHHLRGGGNVRLRSSAPPTAEGERCAAPISNRHIARPWGTADLRWLTDARTEWGVCLGEVHRGLFGHGGDGEELVPDAAVDAFAGFAVVAAQLDERLRDEGGVGFESAFFK